MRSPPSFVPQGLPQCHIRPCCSIVGTQVEICSKNRGLSSSCSCVRLTTKAHLSLHIPASSQGVVASFRIRVNGKIAVAPYHRRSSKHDRVWQVCACGNLTSMMNPRIHSQPLLCIQLDTRLEVELFLAVLSRQTAAWPSKSPIV